MRHRASPFPFPPSSTDRRPAEVPYFDLTVSTALHEDAYMSIVNAFSVLDRSFWAPGGADPQSRIFYHSCIQKGVRALRQRTAICLDEVTVMCCGVLSHLELTRTGQARAGLPHVHMAMDVAARWEQEAEWPIGSKAMRETLCQGMLIGYTTGRILYHYLGYADPHLWSGRRQPSFIRDFDRWPIPAAFRHMGQAAEELSEILRFWIIPLARRHKPNWIGFIQPQQCLAFLSDWEKPFRDWEDKKHGPKMGTVEEEVMCAVVGAHGIVARAILEMEAGGWKVDGARRLGDRFDRVLSTMEPLVERRQSLLRDKRLDGYESRSFIFPLFFVASVAVDPARQDRALALLHALDVEEQAWHSRIAWHIAQVVVETQRELRMEAGGPFWQVARADAHWRGNEVTLVVRMQDVRKSQTVAWKEAVLTGEDAQIAQGMKTWVSRSFFRTRRDSRLTTPSPSRPPPAPGDTMDGTCCRRRSIRAQGTSGTS